MADFLGKVAFGTLLGQWLPGCLLILGWFKLDASRLPTVKESDWPWILVAGLLAGLVLDGLNWAARARMERACERRGLLVTEQFVCRSPIWVVALGPVLPSMAIVSALFTRTRRLAVSENLPQISKDKFEAFKWLQEFYLYQGQFFANTAVVAAALSVRWLVQPPGHYGREIVLGSWPLTGLLWLLALRTFATLFWAECCLCESTTPKWQAQTAFGRSDEVERKHKDTWVIQ